MAGRHLTTLSLDLLRTIYTGGRTLFSRGFNLKSMFGEGEGRKREGGKGRGAAVWLALSEKPNLTLYL